MTEFASLFDAGVALGERLASGPDTGARSILVPVLPNGVPVALGIRTVLPLPVVALPVRRTPEGVKAEALTGLTGRTAIVIDDGVETGTVARAVAPVVRASGVARVVLAVPVCSREASADLALLYDAVVAVSTPLVPRSLASHFVDFDTISDDEALRLLSELPS